MISVAEAYKVVMGRAQARPIVEADLVHALGFVLAESIIADRDFPPFDRVCMDGICVHSVDLEAGKKSFEIKGAAFAGTPQVSFQGAGTAIEVMTGAILPDGYDVVIPVEAIEVNAGFATISDQNWPCGTNIQGQGVEEKKGNVLLDPGTVIGTAEIGVLATVGKQKVKVYKPFNIAVVSTGDELVPVDQVPQAFQIRGSNGIQLKSIFESIHQEVHLFHLNDEPKGLFDRIKDILQNHDMLILSGGVSKGKKDYLPQVLEQLGVKKHFHRVAQKPGKPFWFGESVSGKAVFAFPGNPVSTFLCAYKYAIPFIYKSMGQLEKPQESAVLSTDIHFKKSLTYFPTVQLTQVGANLTARFNPGKGSGDLAALLDNDAFIQFPAEVDTVQAGTVLPIIRYRS